MTYHILYDIYYRLYYISFYIISYLTCLIHHILCSILYQILFIIHNITWNYILCHIQSYYILYNMLYVISFYIICYILLHYIWGPKLEHSRVRTRYYNYEGNSDTRHHESDAVEICFLPGGGTHCRAQLVYVSNKVLLRQPAKVYADMVCCTLARVRLDFKY